MSRLLCWPRETRRVCRARCRPAGRVLHRHANDRPAHLAGPDRRFVLDDPAHHRQRAPADVRGEAALQRRSRGADLEVPARARGGGVESAHRAGLPQPASGHGGYGEGAGRGVARPTLHDLRRRAADGELGPAPLAGDPRPGRRGVGLSARLDLLFRQGQARGHHAVPRRGIPPTMIRSTLSVTKRTSLASRGMVVAEHPRGAEVGARILARGGNAVDAAVATAFAMTVVEPFMSTIAGAGTMLVHLAKRGETVALDFNGCAPTRAHASMFRVTTGISRGLFAWPNVENAANERGWLAPAVPGSVAGLSLALERYGTLALRDAIQPAIELARGGFITDWYQALSTARQLEELAAAGEAGRVYLRNGRSVYRPPTGMEEGDRTTYPDLARSLELIAHDGPSAFYRGEIAQAIHDAMAAHGGLITRDDLAAYSVRVGPPLTGTYRGLELAFAPGATGGVTALEILNILEQFPKTAVGWRTPGGLNRRALAVRRAFGDRFEHLGDPAVIHAPWDRLVSKEYAREVATELRRRSSKRGRRREIGR